MTARRFFCSPGHVVHALRLVVPIFCLSVITGGCAGSSSNLTPHEVGTIEGRVLQDPDGTPLKDAGIHVYSSNPQVNLRRFSDADGYYHITDLPTGSYEVTISHSSHESITHDNVRVGANAVTKLAATRLKRTDGEYSASWHKGLDPLAGVFFAIGGSLVGTGLALGDEVGNDAKKKFYWGGGISIVIGILIQLEQSGTQSQAIESVAPGPGVGLSLCPNGGVTFRWRTSF